MRTPALTATLSCFVAAVLAACGAAPAAEPSTEGTSPLDGSPTCPASPYDDVDACGADGRLTDEGYALAFEEANAQAIAARNDGDDLADVLIDPSLVVSCAGPSDATLAPRADGPIVVVAAPPGWVQPPFVPAVAPPPVAAPSYAVEVFGQQGQGPFGVFRKHIWIQLYENGVPTASMSWMPNRGGPALNPSAAESMAAARAQGFNVYSSGIQPIPKGVYDFKVAEIQRGVRWVQLPVLPGTENCQTGAANVPGLPRARYGLMPADREVQAIARRLGGR